MRILLWHGYLLGGTGSNVYTRAARARVEPCRARRDRAEPGAPPGGVRPRWSRDRAAGRRRLPAGLRARPLRGLRRRPAGARLHAGGARALGGANAAAVRELLPADLVFTNHVLLGGPVGAASGAPYAVKAHGSELEYAMRGRRDLGAWGAESLAGARATFVGSAHIRDVVSEVCGPVPRVHEVPPGVDIELWRPEEREDALAALLDEARRDPPNPGQRRGAASRRRERGAARAVPRGRRRRPLSTSAS